MTRTELLKIAKPIIFNTDMVRAILDNRKTVTRRVVNPQIETFGKAFAYKGALCSMDWVTEQSQYKIGDILYVRETWSPVWVRLRDINTKHSGSIRKHTDLMASINHMQKKQPNIFEITDVRCERLQEINEYEAEEEELKE